MVKFYQARFFLAVFLLIAFSCTQVMAQQLPQINYQGVARKADGSPVMEQSIALRLTIRDGGATGSNVYSETRKRTTNKFGLFTVVIGSTGALSQTGSMVAVNWSTGNKFLQVEIDPAGGGSFIDMGTSQLQSVPYAIYASTATPGGAAGGDLSGAYPNPTVTKLQGAALSTAVPLNGQILKWNGTVWLPSDVAATIGKADATTDGYLSKADWLIFNGKATVTYVDAAILTNANALAAEATRATTAEGMLTTAVATKESTANKSTDIAADATSDIKYPSVKSVKTYVETKLSSATPDATAVVKGKIQLAGDLAGTGSTAAFPVISNAAITASKIADAAVTTAKISDGSVNDAKIATGISASKVGLGNVNNTSDTNKPISEAAQVALDLKVDIADIALMLSPYAKQAVTQSALALKAPLESPDLTGTPTAPTALAGIMDTQIATTAFVSTAVTTAATPDATATVKGKIQLAGDLTGTAALPIIADGKITSAKILDGTITGTDISASAGITSGQITSLDGVKITGIVAGANGGTGVVNTDKTITLGGSLTTTGAFATTLTSTAVTHVTLPVSGTLATLTGTETLIGKTFIAPNISTISNAGSILTLPTVAGTLALTTSDISGKAATVTTNANLTGVITSLGNATSIASQTGTGTTFVMNTSATLISPDLGTPSAGVATNLTGTASGLTAGNVTTNANLTGEVTSIGNATTLTNSAVLAKVLTGYVSGAGTIDATDNILTAIQKLNGNINSTSSVDLTTAQTIDGVKTFSADILANGITVGRGSGTIQAINNTVVGHETLTSNIDGFSNTAIGSEALKSNTSGFFNTAIGGKALSTNTEGARNTAIGADALTTNNGNDNTSTGYIALSNNTTGGYNAGFGSESLRFNTTGQSNTAVGGFSLTDNKTGDENTAIGYSSLIRNTTGGGNTAVGANSLSALVTGAYNTALGTQSLQNSNGASSNNTAIGAAAIDGNTTGSSNAVLGAFAGRYISDGSTSNTKIDNSVLIGAETQPNASGETNQIIIGYGATGKGSNTVQLGNGSITLVNTSGAIMSAGKITGASIVKDGGLSSQILMADGSVLTAGTNVTINGGAISASSGSSITEIADEFTATVSQVSFTLTHAPSAKSKVKMYINGIRISNTAYSISEDTLIYNGLNNGSYDLSESDRIQFDYFY